MNCGGLDLTTSNWRHQQQQQQMTSSRFVVDDTIEDSSVCAAASRIATAMVYVLKVNAAANVVELFLHIRVSCKQNQFLTQCS
ncbi:hypothetical protein TNCV_2101791 [Trichonephila clavipes]|nr:hypothetical protein TNCV_2101791 [Trichonephila clavipes]